MLNSILSPFIETPLLALFAIIGLGLLLGRIEIGGVNLGSSGVIFAALLAGHLGLSIPNQVGSVGLVLFVYSVGIGAGNRFFGALKREGRVLAQLAVAVVGLGAIVTWTLSAIYDLSPGMATGIFAGALTSTPALASAIEAAGELGQDVVVGYGVAYPLGIIGVVLFVQLMPRLLKLSLDDSEDAPTSNNISRQLIEVTNPSFFGQTVTDESLQAIGGCQISRVLRQDRLEPISAADTFEEGKILLLVGEPRGLQLATRLLGRASNREVHLDVDNERRRLVLTDRKILGQTLGQFDSLKNHGVVITRIERMDFAFTPQRETRLTQGDILTVVGPPSHLRSFEKFIGHRPNAFSETCLFSLCFGLALGIILGKIQLPLPGGESFSLGLSGGPLIAALILGHFGRVGGLIGYIPRPTRVFLQELGLVFFLADAGVKGGATILEAVQSQGLQIFIIGAIITLIPMLLCYFLARRAFRLPLGQTLGGICGGMTSTPALGAIVSKTSKQSPIVSYATVYPVAVILMALLAKLLMAII
ncbi:aspartate:alanine exchanger family transporter [Pelagicoccus albus]|uniref:YidE/YbjL duplication n=1 Tax=Pelagicoccus albus TaxID=415222 RepID=A0A7X1B8X6_9BACT|nr:TrkA C-terminal domain-containing protein [Pelagicoccus albus]MBC2607841.1 YidE/YbjL duplication [Pelagicoccus albus]